MERIATVGDYKIPLKSNAASMFVYKAQFGKDAMRDLLSLAKNMPNGEVTTETLTNGEFDIDLFYRFLWVFAKAAKPDIPPLVDWLGEFDASPIEFMQAVLPEVVQLLTSTSSTSVASKNHPAARGTKM